MDDNTKKVLDRVKKMLALANDDRAAEGERDNAMRMAHALLAKHNLDMAQLSDTTEDRVEEVLETRNRPWRRYVSYAVGKLFFCSYYFSKSGNKCSHTFIGTPANAATARGISEYVMDSILKEARRASRLHSDDVAEQNSFASSFCKSAAAVVAYRCELLRKEAEQASSAQATSVAGTPGTSIVLASLYQREAEANDAFLAAKGVKLKETKARERDTGHAGRDAGAAHGRSINLSRQTTDQRVRGHLT